MKTEFEELYSEIFHSGIYELQDIRSFYIDRDGLRLFDPYDIRGKENGLLEISRINTFSSESEVVEIPIHTIRMIIHRTEVILLECHDSYQGNKSLILPEDIF